MGTRDHYTPGQREREREANRLRMAAKRADPAYREKVNASRRVRDAERKVADPALRQRLNANSKRYYESRKGDPAFWANRRTYLARWRAERRAGEEFQAFVERLEAAE